MIEHPNEGVYVPDDLPWRDVLRVAGRTSARCTPARRDWDPVTSRRDLFADFADEADGVDPDDPWQFTNFLVG